MLLCSRGSTPVGLHEGDPASPSVPYHVGQWLRIPLCLLKLLLPPYLGCQKCPVDFSKLKIFLKVKGCSAYHYHACTFLTSWFAFSSHHILLPFYICNAQKVSGQGEVELHNRNWLFWKVSFGSLHSQSWITALCSLRCSQQISKEWL